MKFEVVFHTPFRVATGHAGDGSDTTVDRAALLPASSLKGVMLSAARDLLQLPKDWVGKVFGTAWQASPWSWSDAHLTGTRGGDPQIRSRARIRIEEPSLTVATGALLIADEVLAVRAEFAVDRIGWIEPGDVEAHETVVLAAARAVTAIGGDRRRGLGWVTVTPTEPGWSQVHVRAAIELAHGNGAAESGSGAESNGAESTGAAHG